MMSGILRNPAANKLNIQKYVTLMGAKNLVDGYWKTIRDNIVIHSLFDTNTGEVPQLDLEGKTCLITGASSGIGLEMTKNLNARGCLVLMACRNTYAATSIIKNVQCEVDRLRFYELNLASLKSVQNCSKEVIRNEKKIDILILNAGVFGLPWTLTEDGLETTFQVNYLSQYYLLKNLEHILVPDARVIFLSSESHRNINWTTSNMLSPTEELLSLPKDQYTSIKAYNISKLCCILAMHYLGYRWLNTQKQVFCAHPGSFVHTRLCRNWWVYEALYTAMIPFSKSIREASKTPLYCATSPDLIGLSAQYYKNCQRCNESDLGKDFHLSFRIQDLTRDMLRQRIESDQVVTKVSQPTDTVEHRKENIESLISNTSI